MFSTRITWVVSAMLPGFVLGMAHSPAIFAATDAGQCSALTSQTASMLGEPTAHIQSARLNAASAAAIDPKAPFYANHIPAMPEHCEALGTMRERIGTDGQHYAVRFRVRLPTQWNGRFLFEGGGGTNGTLGLAVGTLQPEMPTALEQGYAVVSTDTGHDNTINNDPARQGTVAFGHDYQARVEYSETALDSVATTAKKIVQAYYGRKADHNYFAGCSNGGREGMVFAQRFPQQFDGIVAGAPAFAVPKAAIAEAWDSQTFAALAKSEGRMQPDGLPDLAQSLTDGDLRIVAEATARACDADDGVKDGMIQDVLRCTTARVRSALEARVCKGDGNTACVSEAVIQALIRSHQGPHSSKGQALYAQWPWDLGIADMSWRIWKVGIPGAGDAINVMLGSPALSGLFVTPPATVAATGAANLRYQLDFDFDRDAPKIFATTPDFPRSGWDLVGAQSTDLASFRAHGGKLLVPHGGSDPIFSINDTVAWWRQVDGVNHGAAATFVRVFAVPGMTHCVGGPSTDRFDALSAVVDWVEKGTAPDRIEAIAGPQTPWPGRTRPLCPYPRIARYTSGDINRAASFACTLASENRK